MAPGFLAELICKVAKKGWDIGAYHLSCKRFFDDKDMCIYYLHTKAGTPCYKEK